MAISNNKYVDITTKEIGSSVASRRNLMPRFIVNNSRIGIGHIYEFSNSNDVKSVFGIDSDEYKVATKAFSYVSNAATSVGWISFARWSPVAMNGHLLSKKVVVISDVSGSNHKMAFSAGGRTVTIDFGTITGGGTLETLCSTLNTVLGGDDVDELVKDGQFSVVTFGNNSYIKFTFPDGVAGEVSPCVPFNVSNDMATALGLTENAGVVCSNKTEAETPVSAMERIDGLSDNFGSFAFLPYKDATDSYVRLTAAETIAVENWNAALNCKYLFSMAIEKNNVDAAITSNPPIGVVGVAYDTDWDIEEFMPMALFASTNYGRQNGTNNQMYKQFADVKPAVTETMESDVLDALHINYYGLSQQAGKNIAFYQRGYNLNGEDTATYCNEVWLKDAIKTELLNLQLSVQKIPANYIGEAQCVAVIRTVVDEALNNGTIIPGAKLNATQKVNAVNMLGDDAPDAIESDGFYLKVAINSKMDDNGTELHYLDYFLGYKKGDTIRKVEGSHGLL